MRDGGHGQTASKRMVKEGVKGKMALLLSVKVENVFRASIEKGDASAESLLDLDATSDTKDKEERAQVANIIHAIHVRLWKLNKISRERSEGLNNLKEKVCLTVQKL